MIMIYDLYGDYFYNFIHDLNDYILYLYIQNYYGVYMYYYFINSYIHFFMTYMYIHIYIMI